MKRNDIFLLIIVFIVWLGINFVNIKLFLKRDNKYWSDQWRYINQSESMIKSSWSVNGNTMVCMPGYPFLLSLFRRCGIDYDVLRYFLNPLLLTVSSLFFLLFINGFFFNLRIKRILFFSFAFFPLLVRYVHMFLTEIPSLMFLSISLYFIYKVSVCEDKKHCYLYIIPGGIFFGCLSYIRAQHGYVVIFMLFIYGLLFLFSKKKQYFYYFLLFLLAFIFLLPYLYKTYRITGVFPYFTVKAGESLYFMASAYPHELGDYPGRNIYEDERLIHHKIMMDSLDRLPSYEKDLFLKKYALNQVLHHPVNYVKNLFFNFLRLTTGGPYTYNLCSWKKRVIYSIWNLILLLFTIFVVYKYRVIDKYSSFLYGYFIILFLLTIMPSTYPRFFVPFVGICFYIIAYSIGRENA